MTVIKMPMTLETPMTRSNTIDCQRLLAVVRLVSDQSAMFRTTNTTAVVSGKYKKNYCRSTGFLDGRINGAIAKTVPPARKSHPRKCVPCVPAKVSAVENGKITSISPHSAAGYFF